MRAGRCAPPGCRQLPRGRTVNLAGRTLSAVTDQRWHQRISSLADRSAPILFPAPAVVVLLALVGFPMVFNTYLSLHAWFIAGSRTFVGLDNFIRILLDDGPFREAVVRTAYLTVLAIGAQLLLGMAIALLLHQEFRGSGLVRVLFVLPMVTTPVAVALIWELLYHPTLGVTNYLLSLLGLPPVAWLASSRVVIPALALVDTWQYTPFIVLVLLAGLASLPLEPFEAARIDGASGWQTLRYLTLPLLRPTIMVALLFRVIDSLKNFDVIYVMTQGGPGRASETINLYAFQTGFQYFHFGYAAALALVLTLLVLGVSTLLLQFRRAG